MFPKYFHFSSNIFLFRNKIIFRIFLKTFSQYFSILTKIFFKICYFFFLIFKNNTLDVSLRFTGKCKFFLIIFAKFFTKRLIMYLKVFFPKDLNILFKFLYIFLHNFLLFLRKYLSEFLKFYVCIYFCFQVSKYFPKVRLKIFLAFTGFFPQFFK